MEVTIRPQRVSDAGNMRYAKIHIHRYHWKAKLTFMKNR